MNCLCGHFVEYSCDLRLTVPSGGKTHPQILGGLSASSFSPAWFRADTASAETWPELNTEKKLLF